MFDVGTEFPKCRVFCAGWNKREARVWPHSWLCVVIFFQVRDLTSVKPANGPSLWSTAWSVTSASTRKSKMPETMGRRATRRRRTRGVEKTARMSPATAAPTPSPKASATPRGASVAIRPWRGAGASPWPAWSWTPPAERRGAAPASPSPPRARRNRWQKSRNRGAAPSTRGLQVSSMTCWRCTTRHLPWITSWPLQTARLSSWGWNDLLGGWTRLSRQTEASRARLLESGFGRATLQLQGENGRLDVVPYAFRYNNARDYRIYWFECLTTLLDLLVL